jgi:hypothetical protein
MKSLIQRLDQEEEGCLHQKEKKQLQPSSIPFEGEFLKDFMRMKMMVEELYQDRKKGEQGGPSHTEDKK